MNAVTQCIGALSIRFACKYMYLLLNFFRYEKVERLRFTDKVVVSCSAEKSVFIIHRLMRVVALLGTQSVNGSLYVLS